MLPIYINFYSVYYIAKTAENQEKFIIIYQYLTIDPLTEGLWFKSTLRNQDFAQFSGLFYYFISSQKSLYFSPFATYLLPMRIITIKRYL